MLGVFGFSVYKIFFTSGKFVVNDKMKKQELKKVLLVATGALMSPTSVYQHLTIPSIAHAVSLEVIQ